MSELLTALALILVIEGALYALFPGGMRRMLMEVLRLPDETVRGVGLVAALVGGGALWLLLT